MSQISQMTQTYVIINIIMSIMTDFYVILDINFLICNLRQVIPDNIFGHYSYYLHQDLEKLMAIVTEDGIDITMAKQAKWNSFKFLKNHLYANFTGRQRRIAQILKRCSRDKTRELHFWHAGFGSFFDTFGPSHSGGQCISIKKNTIHCS